MNYNFVAADPDLENEQRKQHSRLYRYAQTVYPSAAMAGALLAVGVSKQKPWEVVRPIKRHSTLLLILRLFLFRNYTARAMVPPSASTCYTFGLGFAVSVWLNYMDLVDQACGNSTLWSLVYLVLQRKHLFSRTAGVVLWGLGAMAAGNLVINYVGYRLGQGKVFGSINLYF